MHIKKDSASVYQWMAETLHSIDFNPINSLNDSPPPKKSSLPITAPMIIKNSNMIPPPKTIIDEKQPP